jgi:hypothetical protein
VHMLPIDSLGEQLPDDTLGASVACDLPAQMVPQMEAPFTPGRGPVSVRAVRLPMSGKHPTRKRIGFESGRRRVPPYRFTQEFSA